MNPSVISLVGYPRIGLLNGDGLKGNGIAEHEIRIDVLSQSIQSITCPSMLFLLSPAYTCDNRISEDCILV